MRDAGSVSGAGAGCCGPGAGGGLKFEVGALGSVAAGDGDEKPIFKGVWVAGGICGGLAADGFNFSGKCGSPGASGWWGEAPDEPGNSGVKLCFPSGSRGRSPHRLDSDGSG